MRWMVAMMMMAVAAAAEVPGVEAVISERVAKAPAPADPAVPALVRMAVTSSSGEAQDAVGKGMTCLHAGWDFEAYRHFCQALKADPDCLMAHWGVVISLLQADPDQQDERDAALARMEALVEAGVGTDIELRYVFGLRKLLAEGAGEAASAFAALAEKYPNDPQARLFKCLFTRGGYDEFGEVTPDEERAEKEMRETIARHPDAVWLRHALLLMRAEAPRLEDDLDMARGLVLAAPGFAPYWHVLGHYEWRCGNHARAALAFSKEAELLMKWMDANGFTALECPQWTRAECYHAVALASKGDYEPALTIAKAVAAVPVPPERAGTNGGRMLLWEGKILPVRVLMRRSGAGDMRAALELMPPKEDVKRYGKNSLVGWSYQAYMTMLGARISAEEGNDADARAMADELTRLGESFVKTRQAAAAMNERSEWLRFFKALEVMASEMRGMIALEGPEDGIGSAFNWFRSAADRQARPTLMMPPAVLLPMEVRLGQYYGAKKDWKKAVEAMIAGVERWPNDWELLNHLQIAFSAAGMKEQADDVALRLSEMRSE